MAARRIERAQHPSKYGGVSLQKPPMKRVITVSAAGNALGGPQARNRMVAAAREANLRDVILENVDDVEESTVDKIIDGIIHAADKVGGVTINLPGDAPAITDPTKKWAAAQQGAGDFIAKNGMPCNMVFGGSGVCGIGYINGYQYLTKLGLTSSMTNFAGCSSGAIMAALLALKMEPARISRHILDAKFSKFARVSGGSGLRFIRRKGIDNGKALVKWIKMMIVDAGAPADITLKQIHEQHGGRLVINAYNIDTTKAVYFDYRTDPDLELWRAIRMSTAIPWVFTPHEYNGCSYVDGGVVDPYPIRAFHTDDVSGDIINPRTLGMMSVSDGVSSLSRKKGSFVQHSAAIFDGMLSKVFDMMLDEQDWARTIVVDCGKMSSLDFGINTSQKEALLGSAATAVVDHFAKTKAAKKSAFCAATGHSLADEPAMPSVPVAVRTKGKEKVV